MMHSDVNEILGNTDIYLIDQVMKGRYKRGDVLLDAGCGGGRNLHWFIRNDIKIYGIDYDHHAIQFLQHQYAHLPKDRFRVNTVEDTSFENNFFDGIICSAVLHFAKDKIHFFKMMDELHRVLKPGGSLFIRMTSDIGIEEKTEPVEDGVFLIPDGSMRFLLTRKLLKEVMEKYKFSFMEELKTVNVNDQRCMTTLVLQKSPDAYLNRKLS
jgi:tellurite methyltransferase